MCWHVLTHFFGCILRVKVCQSAKYMGQECRTMKDDPWPMVSPAKFTREIRKDQVRIGNRCHLQRFPMKNHEKVQTKTAHGTKNSLAGLAYVPLATWFSAADGTFSTRFNMFQRPWGTAPWCMASKKGDASQRNFGSQELKSCHRWIGKWP